MDQREKAAFLVSLCRPPADARVGWQGGCWSSQGHLGLYKIFALTPTCWACRFPFSARRSSPIVQLPRASAEYSIFACSQHVRLSCRTPKGPKRALVFVHFSRFVGRLVPAEPRESWQLNNECLSPRVAHASPYPLLCLPAHDSKRSPASATCSFESFPE